MKRHYIIPIFVPHKGCPHDCVFCNQKKITGKSDDIGEKFVEDEIIKYLSTIPKDNSFIEVSFYGGSFTGLPITEQKELLKPAKIALDKGMINAIRLSTRPDYIDECILDNLKLYGVSIIELGVQSLDDYVLLSSNRGHTTEDVYKASRLIKDYNFILGLQMMIGLPGDTEDKDIMTADKFVKIKPDMVRIYPALTIKDTYMEEMYREGTYLPLALDDAVDICSKVYLKFIREEINVIRIGLQPTENIQMGRDIIAGPFHPAFRELVESKILNDIIRCLCDMSSNNIVHVNINEKSLSKIYADKKKYFNGLVKNISGKLIKVKVNDNIPINTIMLQDAENSLTMSIKDYSLII